MTHSPHLLASAAHPPLAVAPEEAADTLPQEAPTPAARAKKIKGPKSADTLEELGVPAGSVQVIKECEVILAGSDRVDAEQVFVRGAALETARKEFASQEAFEKWSKKRCGLSRRAAENYVKVHQNLSPFRAQLVESNVQRVAMYALSLAPVDKIEAVVAKLKAGERPTVAEVKAFVADGAIKPVLPEAANVAGSEGLKALIREKTSVGVPVLIDHLAEILEIAQTAALRHAAGKRLIKSALVKEFAHRARRARAELVNLALYLAPPFANDHWRADPAEFPKNTSWYNLSKILYRAGGTVENWPKGNLFEPWFIQEVLPALQWAVGPKVAEAMAKAVEVKLQPVAKPDDKKPGRTLTPKKVSGPATKEAGADVPNATPAKAVTMKPSPAKAEKATTGLIGGWTPAEFLKAAIAPKRAAKAAGKGELEVSAPVKEGGDSTSTRAKANGRKLKSSLADTPALPSPETPPRGKFGPPSFMKVRDDTSGSSPDIG